MDECSVADVRDRFLIATNKADARWQAADSASFAWCQYPDGYVVYHRPSGKTHFLNASAFLLLTEILDRPKTAEQAAGDLIDNSDLDTPPAAELAATLEHFAYLGLVNRVD